MLKNNNQFGIVEHFTYDFVEHFTYDPVRQSRSERFGTLNAVCELETARGVYEWHSSASKVSHALKTSAFRSTAVIFVRPVPFRAHNHVAAPLKSENT